MRRMLLLTSRADLVIAKHASLLPKRLVCIPTAANIYEKKDWLEAEKQAFRDAGFYLDDFDLTGKTAATVTRKLADAEAVYVTGGNSYYLLEQMRACGFEAILKKRLAEGLVYIGSSAGTVVASPDIGFIEDMDDPSQATLADYRGLHLVDFKILPHLDHPAYGPQAQDIVRRHTAPIPLMSLRDDQAILVQDDSVEIR